MPDTKNFSLRIKILDGLLRKEDGVSMKDILRVINNRLEDKGVPPVTSRDTILNDITELSNEFHVKILRRKAQYDSRVILYRYANVDFSIYHSPLSFSEIKEMRGALSILSKFEGMPQYGWINELCARFDISFENHGHPVVQFEDSVSDISHRNFTGLYHAIVDKTPIHVTYQRFGHKEREHIVHPYFLKQFRNRWYLIARNSKHLDSICPMSLDRLKSFQVDKDIGFVPIGMNVNDYYHDVYGICREEGKSAIDIKFYVNSVEVPYIITCPIHHSQRVVARNAGGAIFTIHVIPNYELMQKFLSFGDNVVIITECDMKQLIVKKLRDSLRKYKSSK